MPAADGLKISILTAGRDPYYALGLLSGLAATPLRIDFVANDAMREAAASHGDNLQYWSIRRERAAGAPRWRKFVGVVADYVRLVRYAARSDAALFHILWYNQFEWLDNTLLLSYYKALGKRVVLTVHNVDRKERDGKRDIVHRWSLRFLYRHVDHIFVHTQQMKEQLIREFAVSADRITAIPFGVNSFVVESSLSRDAARRRLRLEPSDRVLLFFGNIAPYKGVDIAVEALERLPNCRLVIAGPVKKGCEDHWRSIERAIVSKGLSARVLADARFIPEDQVEVFFKAADVVVLPYRTISQSGVLFLAYHFGVPVIASAVGGFSEAMQDGVTGYLCPPEDPIALADAIARYFDSDLFKASEAVKAATMRTVTQKHSWTGIADQTYQVYAKVMGQTAKRPAVHEPQTISPE